jgi:hypothetical protein
MEEEASGDSLEVLRGKSVLFLAVALAQAHVLHIHCGSPQGTERK